VSVNGELALTGWLDVGGGRGFAASAAGCGRRAAGCGAWGKSRDVGVRRGSPYSYLRTHGWMHVTGFYLPVASFAFWLLCFAPFAALQG